MTYALSTVASLLLVLTVTLYFLQVKKGTSTPNPATWIIWASMGIFDTVTYFSVVDGDMTKWVVTCVAAVGLSVTFIYSAVRGKFSRVGMVEIISFVLAAGVFVLWRTTGDDTVANVSLQFVTLISFVPTIIGLHKDPTLEAPPPWICALLAYIFMAMSILASNDWAWNWAEMARPLITGIGGNGVVLAFILKQK